MNAQEQEALESRNKENYGIEFPRAHAALLDSCGPHCRIFPGQSIRDATLVADLIFLLRHGEWYYQPVAGAQSAAR